MDFENIEIGLLNRNSTPSFKGECVGTVSGWLGFPIEGRACWE